MAASKRLPRPSAGRPAERSPNGPTSTRMKSYCCFRASRLAAKAVSRPIMPATPRLAGLPLHGGQDGQAIRRGIDDRFLQRQPPGQHVLPAGLRQHSQPPGQLRIVEGGVGQQHAETALGQESARAEQHRRRAVAGAASAHRQDLVVLSRGGQQRVGQFLHLPHRDHFQLRADSRPHEVIDLQHRLPRPRRGRLVDAASPTLQTVESSGSSDSGNQSLVAGVADRFRFCDRLRFRRRLCYRHRLLPSTGAETATGSASDGAVRLFHRLDPLRGVRQCCRKARPAAARASEDAAIRAPTPAAMSPGIAAPDNRSPRLRFTARQAGDRDPSVSQADNAGLPRGNADAADGLAGSPSW